MTTRHYSLIKGFALAALLPLFAACSSEDDAIVQDGEVQPVQIDITRATTDGNDWTWENGDQLKLYVTSYGSDTPTEETLTYNGSTSTWNRFNVTLPATVEACYPATASAFEFSFQHNNEAEEIRPSLWLNGTVDQSSEDKLVQNDWMTSGQNMISNLSLSLTLLHRLAKVTVTITSDKEVNEVKFFSYTPNAPTGVTSVTPDYLAVNPLKSSNGNTYTAIVSAFNYNGETGYLPFMRIKVGADNTEKWVNLPQNIGTYGSLSAGNAYTFNLTVNSTNTLGTRSAGTSDCELELIEVRDMNEE